MKITQFEKWWLEAGKPAQFSSWILFRADIKSGKIVLEKPLTRPVLRKYTKELRDKYNCNVVKPAKKEIKERVFDENCLENTHLKNQLRVKENEIRKLQDMAAVDYVVIRAFKESIKRFDPPKLIETFDNTLKITSEEVVVLLSDIHYGEKISSEAMLDSNSYDVDIAKERLNNWYNNIKTILGKLSGYNHKKINLFMLGDMVSGMIHEELKQGTCEVDQVLELAEILSQIVLELSKDYEIDVCCVVGNHGRMTKKPSFKAKYNNFDYLVYKFIETRCANLPNVTFNIPKSGMLIKQVQGYNFLLRHGDCKAQSFAGIPFYGIQRASSKITQTVSYLKDTFINYEVLGHFHTTNVLEKVGGSIIMNGTLKGGDEFALESMLTSCDSRQSIFGVHKEHGKTWMFDIHCA